MLRAASCVAVAIALSAASSGGARGSIFDTYGFSARGVAMGNAQVALGVNYDAAYYNPANILLRKRTHIGLGLNLVAPGLTVDRLDGADPLRIKSPSTDLGMHLGISTPFSGVFDEKVGLGVAFFHPLTSGTRVSSTDPGDLSFYRYQDLPDKLVLAMALAFEPIEWLRLGVGVQLLAEFSGEVQASLSIVEGRFTRERIDVELVPALAPTAGLSVGPFAGLRFGVTYRHALDLQYEIPVTATLEGIGDLTVYVQGTSLYTPSQLALGLSWESAPVTEPGFAIEAGVTWALWDAAPPAAARFELSIDDREVRPPTDPQDAPERIIDVAGEQVPLGARDTLTPRIGAEWRVDPRWVIRGGYFYRPTPLPTPIHQTNSLDATAHVLSLGGGFAFADPIGVHEEPIQVDLSAQVSLLEDRLVRKAADGRPNGSYRFGGAVWHVTLDIRHDFK